MPFKDMGVSESTEIMSSENHFPKVAFTSIIPTYPAASAKMLRGLGIIYKDFINSTYQGVSVVNSTHFLLQNHKLKKKS